MAKKDLGRFRYRGTPNGRLYLTDENPSNPVEGDTLIFPGAGAGRYYIKKQSDESVTNSTALQNDDDFVYNFVTPGVYLIETSITYRGALDADIKIDWVASAGAAQVTTRRCIGPAAGTTIYSSSDVVRMSAHNLTTSVRYGTYESEAGVIMESFIVDTAATGTLQMRWAQYATSTTATVISLNSYLLIERLKDLNVPAIKNYASGAWGVIAF